MSMYNEENMRGINIRWHFTVKNSGHIMEVACLSTLKANIGTETHGTATLHFLERIIFYANTKNHYDLQ